MARRARIDELRPLSTTNYQNVNDVTATCNAGSVTLALAWLDGDVAYLCWDSAIARIGGTVQVPISSFGEAQDVDGTPVEEGAIKLHQVAGLPVLIAGPVRRALACCDDSPHASIG
jgi:hypothetical protein